MLHSKLLDGLKRLSTPFRTRNPHRDGARRGHDFRRPRLECLERRELLSVAGWVTTAPSPHSAADDLVTDLEGNVYVSGGFFETADFAPGVEIPGDPDILTAADGGFEVCAAKYKPDGTLDWVSSLGPPSSLGFYTSIALDEVGGSIYVTTQTGDLWKVNGSDGDILWSDIDSTSLRYNDIAVDSATGDIYTTGSFSGGITTNDTVSGEPITLTSAGYDDIYVARANSDGLLYWVQQKGSRRTSNAGHGITVDPSGNVYVTGHIKDKGLGTKGASDIFVSKLNPADGSFAWIKRAGGDSNHAPQYGDIGYEITVDNSGGVYVTGSIGPEESSRSEPADFGSFEIDLPLYTNVTQYGVVTKLNDDGDFQWAVPFGGDQTGGAIGGSLDFDSTGQLHLGGRASGGGVFGTINLGDQTGRSIGFWATMNAATGAFQSAVRVGTMGNPGADTLALDLDDNLFMAGWLYGLDQEFLTGDVLSSTLDENGDPTYDMVLVKLLLADDPTNTPPVAGDDLVGTPEDAPLTISTADLLANDSDDDDDPLTIQSFGSPGHGTLLDNQDGTITYTPDADFNGTDDFTYTISDGRGGQDTATVTVDVTPVDDAPIADAGGPYTVPEGGSVPLDASGSTDPDLPNDSLTYAWDFDYDGIFDDESGVWPTFDATGLASGSVVDVAVRVTDSSELSDIAATTVEVQSASPERTYTSTDGPILIGDLKTVTSTVLATYSEPIDALNVRIDLTHADAANLEVRLLDPNGEALILASVLDSGDLYYGVVISEGTSPQHSGTWTLEITDSAKDKLRGTLYGWSLIVNPTTPLLAEAAAASTAVDQALLAWVDLDSSDDDDSDILTQTLVDDLALMLVE